jgi:hypothetical protein
VVAIGFVCLLVLAAMSVLAGVGVILCASRRVRSKHVVK